MDAVEKMVSGIKSLATPLQDLILHEAITDRDYANKAAQELADKDAALAEARELLAVFAEQAELIAHLTCDDSCEYQQAAAWIKKYGAAK
jgi:hypothetical protein